MSTSTSAVGGQARIHVAWVDAALDSVPTVTDWLDRGHAREVLERGDWGRVRRYQCSSDPGLQLVVYDGPPAAAAGAEVAPVPPYAFRSEVGRRLIRTYAADTFEAVSEYGSLAATPQLLNAIVVQVATEGTAAFDAWYEDVHVPEIVACPGWRGARRYHSAAQPGRFLAMYDLADLVTPFRSAEYDGAVGWDDLEHLLVGYHGFRTYELAAVAGTAPR